jgi:hypothetical protein
MKRILILLLSSLSILTASSQEKVKIKEIGISFQNKNDYGFLYRIGNTGSVWRISSSFFIEKYKLDNKIQNSEYHREAFGYSLALGKEFRKSLNDKLEFRYGAEVFYSYQKEGEDSRYPDDNSFIVWNYLNRNTRSSGLHLMIGFNYLIESNFVIGLEINPRISYQEVKQNQILIGQGLSQEFNSINDGYGFGLNQKFALLSIIYRFNK